MEVGPVGYVVLKVTATEIMPVVRLQAAQEVAEHAVKTIGSLSLGDGKSRTKTSLTVRNTNPVSSW